MRFSTLVSIAVLLQATLALPHLTPRGRELIKRVACNDKQESRLFVLPDRPADPSSKKIPDADHPFMAPGPNDTRGPCPALNTLANHGYIDRSGVDTAENIINAAVEGMNMERDFSAFATALGVLTRGNANTATLSIGHPSDKVPPLPGCMDGPVALGLATHGRFEGDVSITRVDKGLGDNADFDQTSFQRLLDYIAKYGDDGPDGPRTVLNVKTMQELKYDIFTDDQAKDKQMQYHIDRQLTGYAETTFMLELFQDGRTNQTSVKQLTHFFQNQTFGPDFYRRGNPAGIDILGPIAGNVMMAHPVPAGANDENGNYVVDTPHSTNFICDGYAALGTIQLPATLANVTDGIFGQNVKSLTDAVYIPFKLFSGCPKGVPSGPIGV